MEEQTIGDYLRFIDNEGEDIGSLLRCDDCVVGDSLASPHLSLSLDLSSLASGAVDRRPHCLLCCNGILRCAIFFLSLAHSPPPPHNASALLLLVVVFSGRIVLSLCFTLPFARLIFQAVGSGVAALPGWWFPADGVL